MTSWPHLLIPLLFLLAPFSLGFSTQPIALLRRPTSRSGLTKRLALIPLSVPQAERLLSTGAPTGAQYATYWGRTPRERYGRLLESCLVGFLGVFFSYFLSFVVGGFPATILGTLFFFWGILSPELQAYQRNWEFLGGRPLVDLNDPPPGDPDKAGLYSAIYCGHITDVCVVEYAGDDTEYDIDDFDDYTMVSDEMEKYTGLPYLLRVRCSDQTGRELQVHARLSEEYVGGALEPGLPVTTVLLSTQAKFTRLAALSDLYVPDANLWIGDYPYLDRDEMETLFATDDDLWDALQAEAVEWQQDDTDLDRSPDDNEDEEEYGYRDATEQDDLVPARRRKRRYS
jgi:hypothetical protein